jgi:basic membrane protein A and related proteins
MRITPLVPAALLCAVVLAASACRRPAHADDDRSRIHVGIVFDIGGKDDRSFNAAAFAGVRCAETGAWPNGQSCGKPALGIVLRDIEPGNPTSIEPALRAFAERGYDLIIGVGFAQAPIIETVAKDYPDIHFAIVDGVSDLPNVASLIFKEQEGA